MLALDHGDGMTRSRSLALLAPLLLVAACTAPPASMVTLAGSSIVVPVDRYPNTTKGVKIGFAAPARPGIPAIPDPQRGGLEFFVDDGADPGETLTLRATTVIGPSLGTAAARDAFALGSGLEVVSLLDIPVNAPPGNHTLRFRNTLAPTVAAPIGALSILPNSVSLPEGNFVGQRTVRTIGGFPVDLAFPELVPDPLLVVSLPSTVWSILLTVQLPPGFELVDAFERRSDRTVRLAWTSVSVPLPGYYEVTALALDPSGIQQLALAFRPLGSSALSVADPALRVVPSGYTARDGSPASGFPPYPHPLPASQLLIE
jgi:hypothetical protein